MYLYLDLHHTVDLRVTKELDGNLVITINSAVLIKDVLVVEDSGVAMLV